MQEHVWIIQGDTPDIVSVFDDSAHIPQTLRNSNSRVQDLSIVEATFPNRQEYRVTGSLDGQPFERTIIAYKAPVNSEPSYL
jgi:hypothetical protein